MENQDKILIETHERMLSNVRRIERLEQQSASLSDLATSVKLMAQNLEQMNKELSEQGRRLQTLEKQPAERWNTMTRTIFTSVLSTLAGGLVGALVALLIK